MAHFWPISGPFGFSTAGRTALTRLLLSLWFRSDRAEEKTEVLEYFKQMDFCEQETRDPTFTNIV